MLIVLLLLLSVIAVESTCPSGYTQFNGVGDCFKLYIATKDFTSAETVCNADGGHLASIHSATEKSSIDTLLTDDENPLIGLKCSSATSCSWTDGTAFDYNIFPGSAPNLDYGSCAYIRKGIYIYYSQNCAVGDATFICRVAYTQGSCTNGYVAYGSSCAAVKSALRTHANAESDCAYDGGHLVSIHSSTDDLAVQSLVYGASITSGVHVGLTVQSDGVTYVWSDGTSYNYNNWATGFPNTRYGSCVQLIQGEFGSAGQWTNVDCGAALPYVCQRSYNPVIPSSTVAPVTGDCPAVQYFEDQGSVYSPGYPVNFPANRQCEYLLSTVIGTVVAVAFPYFSTDTATTLTLYDGMVTSTPMAILSYSVNPSTKYQTTQNILKMVFKSSSTPSGSGWRADFQTVYASSPTTPLTTPVTNSITTIPQSPSCPAEYYTANVNVYSPGWPTTYPSLVYCAYHVTAQTSRLSVLFTYVDTESCCDIVTVYDGPNTNSPVLGYVSGQVSNRQFYTTGPYVTLIFSTDSNTEGKGWSAQVYNA